MLLTHGTRDDGVRFSKLDHVDMLIDALIADSNQDFDVAIGPSPLPHD